MPSHSLLVWQCWDMFSIWETSQHTELFFLLCTRIPAYIGKPFLSSLSSLIPSFTNMFWLLTYHLKIICIFVYLQIIFFDNACWKYVRLGQWGMGLLHLVQLWPHVLLRLKHGSSAQSTSLAIRQHRRYCHVFYGYLCHAHQGFSRRFESFLFYIFSNV